MRHVRRVVVVLVALAVVACETRGGDISLGKGDSAQPKRRDQQATPQANPFAESLPNTIRTSRARECIESVLDFQKRDGSPSKVGTIAMRNRCDFNIAVLAAPLEVRRRIQKQDVWHWEGMAGPYARLYVYRQELGRPRFLGDAGAPVLGTPDYVVIRAGERAVYDLVADECQFLPPGRYLAFLQTFAVPTNLRTGSTSTFDLARTVAADNARNAGKPELPPARRFIAVESAEASLVVE